MMKRGSAEPYPNPTRASGIDVRGVLEMVAAAVLIIGFTALLFSYRKELAALGNFGYAGVFIISLVSAATIFVPAPGLALSASTALVLNPLLIGIVGGFGAAIGELTGYLVGKGAVDIKHKDLLASYKGYIEKYGLYAIIVFAAIPNPLFDIVGIAAGALRIPPGRFFLAALLGNVIKYAVVSLLFAQFGASVLSYL
jgi:uncharacterized membrane protein YdjX (TVP38/TMEM64 family)